MRPRVLNVLFIGLIAGCSNRAIVKGALTAEERQAYIEQTGALIPQRLKEPFVSGTAVSGMTKEMVTFLYGQPDRTENNRYGIIWSTAVGSAAPTLDTRDSLWNYFGTDSVSIKRGMVFSGDTLSRTTGDLSR